MKLSIDEAVVVSAEARAVAERVEDPDARLRYARLADHADRGEVPEDSSEALESVVGLALESGRARSVHGPAGVQALLRVWKETPSGRATAQEVVELNAALSALRGLPLGDIRVAASGPGAWSIGVSAGEYSVRLSVDRDAVRLRSLNVGGGGPGE